jgi:signal transduction histidine kinase
MTAASAPKLLIVDDEADQRKALCDTLAEMGFDTVAVESGETALAVLEETSFELLLTDLLMPGMDGIALLRAALAKDPNLVGIVMTGRGTVDTAVTAMKTGALDYIVKPFKVSVILPVLHRALEVRQLRLDKAALEQRLLVRTSELEAANKELESFSSSVSHDLEAPLRAVNGYCGVLLEDFESQLAPEALLLVDKICTSVRRMQQLVEDLLSFSRLGRRTLAKRPLALTDLAHQVLEEIRRQHPDRIVQASVGDLPDCVADPSLVRQVFINLLSNAFKFTRGKNPALVEVGCLLKAGENVYFVRDNGVGFDMKHAGGLFEVFHRLHSPRDFEGTGIGLSLIKRIVERHGGWISAEAEVDKGATFYFTLPGK